MSSEQKPLVIKDFQKAVADSPHLGHALMRNIDIESLPGAMRSQKQLLSMVRACQATTFTANGVSHICTAAVDLRTQAEIDAQATYQACPVQFTTTGTLPAGLSPGTTYFLIFVTNTTFKVATTLQGPLQSGSFIAISDAGTGVHTIVPIVPGNCMNIAYDNRLGYRYIHDSNGRVWFTQGGNDMYLLNGNSLTGAAGNGLIPFKVSDGSKTWLFVFRNAAIDLIEITSDSTLYSVAWTTSWQSLNSGSGSGNTHKGLLGQDNIIYYPDDRYVGSIKENLGQIFDPTNAATYTFNSKALTLPQGELAQTMDELGVNLLTGGLNYNKVYPWDRISSSFTLPIQVPENGIYKIKNLGGTVYIFAGTKGNIYTSQGNYAKFFKQIPGYIGNNAATLGPSQIVWGGVAILTTGAFVVGLSSLVSGNSGVYIIYPDGRFLQDNTPYGGSQIVNDILALNDYYSIVYNGGADYSSIAGRAAAGTYVSVYQSALFRVGNKTQKAAYSEIEVQLPKPAATGRIRLKYRLDHSSTFSDFPNGPLVFITDGVTTSFEADIGLTDVENVQIQMEFDSLVEPMQITLIP